MQIKYCDICGKRVPEIPPYMNAETSGMYPMVSLSIIKDANSRFSILDLCHECSTAIAIYVDELKKLHGNAEKTGEETT